MFKLGFRSLCCALSVTCLSAPLLGGCSRDEQTEAAKEGGSIQIALTTTGPNGAVYGFPDNTYLQVATSTFVEWIPLVGAETLLSKTLPVGSYTATLYFSNGTPNLTRTEGMTTTVVEADWTNPQPVTFSINDGQTTPLALHFSVDTLVDLVFDTGTLRVSADVVEQDVEQPATAVGSGATNIYYEVYADDTASYAAALDVEQGVDLLFTMGFHATGSWQQFGSTSVCQYGNVTAASSSNSSGLNLRLRELVGGSGYLCVYETGATDQVSFYPTNYGAPPAGQEAFLPEAAYSFYGGFSGYAGDVYDGTTLQQTALQNATLTSGFFYHQVYDGASQQISTIQGTMTGTIQLQP